MIQGILVTAQQTGILFLLMAVGFIARRMKILDDNTVRRVTDFVLVIVTPCLIISAYQRPFETSMITGLGWSFLAAFAGHGCGIALVHTLYHTPDAKRKAVLRFATVFSNAGFMGIPLEYALYGGDGVFYGIAYVTVFNLLAWTYGVKILGIAGKSLLKTIFNPGTIGLFIGVPLFFLPFRLPHVIAEPLSIVGSLNTPLPMIVIGYLLGGSRILPAFKCPSTWLLLLGRHILVPALMMGIFCLCPFIPTLVKLVTIVACAAPIGMLITMFTLKAKGDVDYAIAAVSLSTLCSILTLPIAIGIAQTLFPL